MVRSLRARLAERNGVSSEAGQWFVVHTYSGHEAKVKKNLESRIETMDMSEKIFEVIVPTEEEIEIHNGQRRTVNKKVYPGYVLVKMKMDDDSWYVVRNTPGVTSFVGMGTKPTPLSDDEVSTIKNQMTAEAPRVKLSLAVGDNVRIVDGPFQDFEGRIDEVNQDRGRVKVLVSMFGRETAVELDFLQVDRNL